MQRYPYYILSQLKKYCPGDRVRLHMPGHKAARPFASLFPVAGIDVTELSFSDDLGSPSSAIARAERDIAEIVGAERAFITTDGSSSGVTACVYAASRRGAKLIVPRNSHKSVFNACRILGVEPVIVQGEEREGVILPPPARAIKELVENDANISGMIVASPDYYGNIAPLSEYSRVLKANRRLLFVDGAHGAHLALEEGREGYCGAFADMWVDGAHKTLPVLTQGAYVCVNDPSLIPDVEEAMSIFRTTSPSYPVMASVEYGVKYYVNNPKKLQRAKHAAEEFKNRMSAFSFYPSRDWAKIAIDFKPLGVSPAVVQGMLEKKGIYAEMNDGRYLLFYLSPSTTRSGLEKLSLALIAAVSSRAARASYRPRSRVLPPVPRTYSYLYALKSPCEWVPLSESEGRMCAQNAGVSPPCFPVVIAGEIIGGRAIEILGSAEHTFGLSQGRIKVVKMR